MEYQQKEILICLIVLLRTGSRNVTAGSQGHGGGPFTWTTSGYGILVDSDGGSIDIQDTSISYKGISKVDTEYYIFSR